MKSIIKIMNKLDERDWKRHDESVEFVRRLSIMTNITFSLPAEDEWEYAARGQKSQNYKYAGSDDLSEVAWYRNNADGATHPVGEMAPNEIGLYDMSGNVYEWCHDRYGEYSSDAQTNPTGASSGAERVLRGGDFAGNCRTSFRFRGTPGIRFSNLGLRLVLSQ